MPVGLRQKEREKETKGEVRQGGGGRRMEGGGVSSSSIKRGERGGERWRATGLVINSLNGSGLCWRLVCESVKTA